MTIRKTVVALWLIPSLCGIGLVALARVEPIQGEAKAPEQVEIPGIENAFKLSPRLYSGGDPHGVESFSALKSLGVRTVISVDGAVPDLESARKFGIRYVHLPIGYDGVPREQAVRLIQAVKTLPGPVFIHCHHGKHRGPTAAAVCGMATEGWSKRLALDWLSRAGTSPDYQGLYSSVRAFNPPSVDELDHVGDLPERSRTPALVETMVRVDRLWDGLKAAQKSGFKRSAANPENSPAHQALQLVEELREAARLPESLERGEAFLREMSTMSSQVAELHDLLKPLEQPPSSDSLKRLESLTTSIGKSCTGCHSRHRDQ